MSELCFFCPFSCKVDAWRVPLETFLGSIFFECCTCDPIISARLYEVYDYISEKVFLKLGRDTWLEPNWPTTPIWRLIY